MRKTRRRPATSSTPQRRRYAANPPILEAPAANVAGPLQGSRAIFTDIGDILGQPVFTTDPPPPQLTRLDIFPFVRHVLESLRSDGFRLGIISNTGDEPKARIDAVLEAAGLFELFDTALLIYSSDVGMTKDSPEIFRLAAERAGLEANPDQCLFVGEDARERSFAAQAGFRVARDLTLLEPVLLAATATMAVITGLDACQSDVVLAALDTDGGPPDPLDFASLLGRLEASRERLPPLYRETVHAPYVARLHALGASGFAQVLFRDPQRERTAGLMLDIAHAILQNGERFADTATDAFEEVVSDLYDGFLSAEDRKGIELPETVVVPPLVKWGNPEFGPYTWPLDATLNFNVGATIVSLPPANARAGLMAWAALAHETAGHDVLSANRGLSAEFGRFVQEELEEANIGFGLPEYWSQRIEETASDVMGILNMGPAAAIGIVAYFRGLAAASGRPPKLRTTGPLTDSHPADILRGYLGASTVALLSFNGASQWANLIEAETDNDLAPIRLGGILVSPEVAKQSAVIVAGAIATRKSAILGSHRLIDIQDWRDRDEGHVATLRTLLTTNAPVPAELLTGVFAAHVVAAAVTGALASDASPNVLFTRMLSILKGMHDGNPSWGPLFVSSPSSISRHFAFKPTPLFTAAVNVVLGHAAAVSIACNCARTSTANLSRTLGQLAVDLQNFQGCVHQAVTTRGFSIGRDAIPNAPETKLIQVVNVIQNAAASGSLA